jgi:hypothetical protein
VNYFDHNDRKNADARIRAQIHNAERAKAKDFDGTLTMSKYDLQARCVESLVISGRLVIGKPRRWSGGDVQLQNLAREAASLREPRCEFSANRAMAGGR